MTYMGDPASAPRALAEPGHLATGPARLLLAAQVAGGSAAGWLCWELGGTLLLALVIGIFGPIALHGAVVAAGFLIAWLASDRPRDHPALWLGALLREWPRSMQLIYQRFAWQAGFPTPAPSGRRRRPVILIHGYASNRGLWVVAAPWFALRGHPVLAPSFQPANGDIDAHVETLRAAIDEATAAEDPAEARAPVHLVCHSMGGLIARAYLRRYGWDGIGAVVTLGTPHHGTPQAWFGTGVAAQQMVPGSNWIRRLAGEEPLAPPGQMVVVISRQDNLAARPSLQTMPLARQIRLSGLGHLAYVDEPRLIDLVLRVLARVEQRWLSQRLEMDPEGWEIVPPVAAALDDLMPLYALDEADLDGASVDAGRAAQEICEPVYAIDLFDDLAQPANPEEVASPMEDVAEAEAEAEAETEAAQADAPVAPAPPTVAAAAVAASTPAALGMALLPETGLATEPETEPETETDGRADTDVDDSSGVDANAVEAREAVTDGTITSEATTLDAGSRPAEPCLPLGDAGAPASEDRRDNSDGPVPDTGPLPDTGTDTLPESDRSDPRDGPTLSCS